MVEEKQIYVSFEEDNYKDNKTELLMCQANFISLQKRMHHLMAIRSQKKRLMSHLSKLTASASFVFERLDGKMPDPTLPKEIKKRYDAGAKPAKKDSGEKIIDYDVRVNELDKELYDIQEKLKNLK